jgi:guanylate kinase
MGGCYAAGKSKFVKTLHKNKLINLKNTVYADPDKIRYQLPETPKLIQDNPWTVGNITSHEVGYLTLLVELHAMFNNNNVIVDGSLQNNQWYKNEHIPFLKKQFPNYKIGIIFVTASWLNILERCWKRAEVTKRCIPFDRLKTIYQAMPTSIKELDGQTDFMTVINNDSSPEITEEFKQIITKLDLS